MVIKNSIQSDRKQTSVGNVPKEWEVVRLGDICKFKRGFSYRSDQIIKNVMAKIRFITIDDLEKEGGLKRVAEKIYLKEEVDVDPTFSLHKGDVLIANTDMSKGFIIGAPLLIEDTEREKLVYSMDLTKLIFDTSTICSKFLFYLLKHEAIRRKMKTFAQGTNVLHLNHDRVKSLEIPLPPLPEQRRIAEILSTVDQAIQRVDEAIARTERLKRGLMQRLLTRGIGHHEFKFSKEFGYEVPKEWEVVRVGDITETSSGGTPSRGKKEYYNGDIPWVKSGELKDNVIYDTEEKITQKGLQNSSAKIFPKGTLLIAMYGATVGKTGILAIDASTNQAICAILPKEGTIDSNFLRNYVVFRRDRLISISSGGAQPNISQEIIRTFKIPLPPLPEQRKIVEILSTVDKKLELERRRKEKLQRIKRGLMNDLLTGRKRVAEA